jgi:Helicase conserved C-terminal domain
VGFYAIEGIKVAPIDSHVSKKVQDETEAALISGELDGVVCVDMFGEGYDFPKLKIAALHAPHKSLVPTLQFIGRFARTTDSATGDATLVAPLSRIRDANARLFQEGIDIAQLIDGAAQGEFAEAASNQQILEILKARRQAKSDYDSVSPLSLELYAHTRIFECARRPEFDRFGATIGRKLKLAKQWMSDDGLIVLLLTVDYEPASWVTSDVLANVRHDVFLLAYNEATRLCYVGSTRRTERLYVDLMQTACEDQHRPISYEVTRRAMAGLRDLRFYNLGMKNTTINTQGESYRVLTGPRAELAVTRGDGRAYVQGHFFCSGEDGDQRETIGASSSSRIWSNQHLTVAGYLRWVSMLNARLSGSVAVAASQFDLVQPSRALKQLPNRVIGGVWNKVAYRDAPAVRLRKLYSAELFSVTEEGKVLNFSISNDDFSIPFRFSLSEGALFRQDDANWQFEVKSGHDDWIDIAVWLSLNPASFFGADKSSFEGVNAMPAPTTNISALADRDIETLDWSGCAIGVEFDGGQGQRPANCATASRIIFASSS